MSDELTEADRKAFREWYVGRAGGHPVSGRDARYGPYSSQEEAWLAALRRERARPAPAARCNCWLGEPGAHGGDSRTRELCPVHGKHGTQPVRGGHSAPAAPEGLAKELHDAAMALPMPETIGDRYATSPDERAGFDKGVQAVAAMLLAHPKLQAAVGEEKS